MAQRWLASCQDPEISTPPSRTNPDTAIDGFNFAFTSRCLSPGLIESPVSTPELRCPTLSTDETHRPRKRPNLSIDPPGQKLFNQNTILKDRIASQELDHAGIGLAFGSPSHPPQPFSTVAQSMSPAQQREYGFHLSSPVAAPTCNSGKWKKITGLLRARSGSKPEAVFYHVQRIDAESHKLGVPVARNRWRNPKSPLVKQDEFEVISTNEAPPPIGDICRFSPKGSVHSSKSGSQGTQTSIPKLEVNIPQTPMDRYSVMFGGVAGVRELAPVGRQGTANEIVGASSASDQQMLKVSGIVRRVTSPTLSRHPDPCLPTASNQTTVPKYSLFPTASAASKAPNAQMSPTSHARPSTAPNLTYSSGSKPNNMGSPQKQKIALQPTQGLSHASSQVGQRPPIDQSKELPRIPSEAQPQAESSRRSTVPSEIFFGIKSLRDSHGVESQQFEMTRPDSKAVQLARSASNARRILKDTFNPITDQEQDDSLISPRATSIEIDRAIAEVERLTSPFTTKLVADETLQLPKAPFTDNPTSRDSSSSSGESILIAADTTVTAPIPGCRKSTMRARLEELSIGIPSPVLEQAEENTPRTAKSQASDQVSAIASALPTHVRHIAARAQAPPTPPPPLQSSPEPISPEPTSADLTTLKSHDLKELKFMPLSKYAPRVTTEVLAKRTGLRPRLPSRSATDDHASFNAGVRAVNQGTTNPAPQQPLTRSATMPLSGENKISSHENQKPSNAQILHGPARIAFAPPAAEVSLARKVSVTKSSTANTAVKPKVVVTRSPSLRQSPNPQQFEEQVAKKTKKIDTRFVMVYEGESRHKPGASLDATLELLSKRTSAMALTPTSLVRDAP